MPGGILENKYETKMELLPHSRTTALPDSDRKLGPRGKRERHEDLETIVLITKSGASQRSRSKTLIEEPVSLGSVEAEMVS